MFVFFVFFILRAIERGSSFVLQGNIFYIVLHIEDVAVYIPPNDEQPINQLRCDPHSGNLLMLVREVIYYIDYPGNVLYTLPQTKERRPAVLTLKMCSTRNRLPQLIYFIL